MDDYDYSDMNWDDDDFEVDVPDLFGALLGSFSMFGSYEDRKVDRYEDGEQLIISTAKVDDGLKSYETAVAHPYYNHGAWVIVQMYDTKDEAQQGHDEWVAKMTAPLDDLPDYLMDCGNAEVSRIADKMLGEEAMRYPLTLPHKGE